MGLHELIGKDWKPAANSDARGFDILEGKFGCKVSALRSEQNKTTKEFDHYLMELTLDNGRKLWKRYYKDNGENIKDLLCDLYTCGVDLPVPDSVSEFEAGFSFAIGAMGTVRCWKWTPEKDKQGNVLPEDQRTPRQQFKIIKKQGANAVTTTEIPF